MTTTTTMTTKKGVPTPPQFTDADYAARFVNPAPFGDHQPVLDEQKRIERVAVHYRSITCYDAECPHCEALAAAGEADRFLPLPVWLRRLTIVLIGVTSGFVARQVCAHFGWGDAASVVLGAALVIVAFYAILLMQAVSDRWGGKC